MQEMSHCAQKQEQLFPWACTVEINNAVIILCVLFHLSTLFHCLNSCQFYFFCNDLTCGSSLCWRIQSYRNVFSPPGSSFSFSVLFIYFNQFIFSSTVFISALVYRGGNKLHVSVSSSFIMALTFPLSAQKQSLYCNH